jgi:hypothetical protein
LAHEYGEPAWAEAATLFDQSGQALVELTDIVVDLLLGEGGSLSVTAASGVKIADLEEQGFCVIRDA